MQSQDLKDIQKWCQKNLINRKEAAEITGQSFDAFSQTIKQGRIKPFLEVGESGPSMIRLYLKSEIEEYGRQLKEKKERQNKG